MTMMIITLVLIMILSLRLLQDSLGGNTKTAIRGPATGRLKMGKLKWVTIS